MLGHIRFSCPPAGASSQAIVNYFLSCNFFDTLIVSCLSAVVKLVFCPSAIVQSDSLYPPVIFTFVHQWKVYFILQV